MVGTRKYCKVAPGSIDKIDIREHPGDAMPRLKQRARGTTNATLLLVQQE
jgi:hypothetical protein